MCTTISFKDKLGEAQKVAMRARDKVRLMTLRMLLAEIRNQEIALQTELSETQIIDVITSLMKQRREAAAQFTGAGRQDLAEKEYAELAVLQDFLPEPLSEAQITTLIDQAIAKTQATSMKDMREVMQYLKPQMQGRVDFTQVSLKIKASLG